MKLQLRLLALATALSLCLAGCGSEEDDGEPVHLTVWHYYNSVQLETFDAMVSEFNQTAGQELGIFVEAQSQGSVSELFDKVLDTARGVAGAGDLPDLFLAYADSAYEVIQMGRAVNLSEYLTEGEIDSYVDDFWQEGVVEGSPYICPVAKSTEALFLNATDWRLYAQAAGLEGSVEQYFSTWEQVLDTARSYYEYTDALTPQPHDGKSLLTVDALANFVLMTMKQQGVDLMQNENGAGLLDLNREALRRVWDVYVGSMAAGWFSSRGHFGSDDVKTGVLLGYIGSTSGVKYFPSVVTYDDNSQRPAEMLVLPMPVFENGEPVVVQQGAGMLVSRAETPDPRTERAAVEFLKWFTEPERNMQFAMLTSYLPVKEEAISGDMMETAITSLMESDDPSQNNTALMFDTALDQLRNYGFYVAEPFMGRLEIRYLLDGLEDVARAARNYVLTAVEQGTPYEQALENVAGEASFQSWYNQFSSMAENILQNYQ